MFLLSLYVMILFYECVIYLRMRFGILGSMRCRWSRMFMGWIRRRIGWSLGMLCRRRICCWSRGLSCPSSFLFFLYAFFVMWLYIPKIIIYRISASSHNERPRPKTPISPILPHPPIIPNPKPQTIPLLIESPQEHNPNPIQKW